MDFDEVLPYIGQFGKYQKLVYVVLCVPGSIPSAFTLFSSIFISATPDHWCKVPELESVLGLELARNLSVPMVEKDGLRTFSKCEMYDVNYTSVLTDFQVHGSTANTNWPTTSCRYGWSYDDSVYSSTLVTKMNVVCDQTWKVSLAGSSFYIGNVFGNLLFGYIGDRFGRRTSFFAVAITNVLIGVLASFPSSYTSYIIYRGIIGLTFPAIFQIPFIMGMELMSPAKRTFSGMVVCIFFSLAMMLLAGIGWLVRDWFALSLICSVPFASFIIYWWILPESPRWLLSRGRVEEAEVLVQKIAKTNGKKISADFLQTWFEERTKLSESAINDDVPDLMSFNYKRLLHYPNVLKKVIVVSFSWTVNTLVYNGLSFGMSNLGVNDYLAFFISAAAEIPGILGAWYSMDKFGRRPTMIVTMTIGGLACLCTIFVPEHLNWPSVLLSSIGKMGITGSFAVIYIYGAELFPTVLRAFALGFASMTASIALILSPHILYLGVIYSRVVPLIILGALTVAGGLSNLFLPETLNVHLPQTLEEGEAFGKHVKFWSCNGKPPRKHQGKGDIEFEETEISSKRRKLRAQLTI